MMIRRKVTVKSISGRYSTSVKKFNSENHFSNWYRLVSRKGYKVVGVEDID